MDGKSRKLVGSSKRSRSDDWQSAHARLQRVFQPPESWDTGFSMRCVEKPNPSNTVRALASAPEASIWELVSTSIWQFAEGGTVPILKMLARRSAYRWRSASLP